MINRDGYSPEFCDAREAARQAMCNLRKQVLDAKKRREERMRAYRNQRDTHPLNSGGQSND